MTLRGAAPKVAGFGVVILAGLALGFAFRTDGGGGTGETPPAYLLLPPSPGLLEPAAPAATPAPAMPAPARPEADAGVWSTPARFAPPE